MASPVEWNGANKLLTVPSDREDVTELHVFNNGICSVSCWQLSREELVELVQNGGKIFVSVMGGASSPPIFVGCEDEVREVVCDYGKVWKK